MSEAGTGGTKGVSSELDQLQWGTLKDWGQLVRLPTVFTILSNVLAAALVAGGWQPLTGLIPVCLASLAAYWAGMILNDVVDIEEDRRDRPSRPLAAGRISSAIAGHVATALLMICPLLILGVTSLHQSQPLWQGSAFLASVLLVLCVRAYDSPLKATIIGPFLMGACRGLNILMVGCTMFSLSDRTEFPWTIPVFAGGVALYILGVTTFARNEETDAQGTGNLMIGLLMQVGAFIVFASLPRWVAQEPAIQWTLNPAQGFPLLLLLIGMTVANRAVQAISHPVSRKVQLAVKHALLTLILIDAAIALMWGGPWYGCAVVCLLLPAIWSAMNFRAT